MLLIYILMCLRIDKNTLSMSWPHWGQTLLNFYKDFSKIKCLRPYFVTNKYYRIQETTMGKYFGTEGFYVWGQTLLKFYKVGK